MVQQLRERIDWINSSIPRTELGNVAKQLEHSLTQVQHLQTQLEASLSRLIEYERATRKYEMQVRNDPSPENQAAFRADRSAKLDSIFHELEAVSRAKENSETNRGLEELGAKVDALKFQIKERNEPHLEDTIIARKLGVLESKVDVIEKRANQRHMGKQATVQPVPFGHFHKRPVGRLEHVPVTTVETKAVIISQAQSPSATARNVQEDKGVNPGGGHLGQERREYDSTGPRDGPQRVLNNSVPSNDNPGVDFAAPRQQNWRTRGVSFGSLFSSRSEDKIGE